MYALICIFDLFPPEQTKCFVFFFHRMSEEKRKRSSQYTRSWTSAKKFLHMTKANGHYDHSQSSSDGIAESWEEIDILEPHNSNDEMMKIDYQTLRCGNSTLG